MKKTWRKTILALISSLTLLLIMVAGLHVYKYIRHNTFPSNTYLGQINIAGKSPHEAEYLLNSLKNKYLNSSITFSYKNESKKILIKDLGIDIKAEETVQSLKPLNTREQSFWEFYFTENPETTIPLITKIDEKKLFTLLDKEFGLSEIHAESANFYFAEDGSLAVREGVNGYEIDSEKVLSKLRTSAKNLNPTIISLAIIKEEANLTAADLEPMRDEILAQLNNKLALVDPIYSDDWYIKLIDYPDWVKFEAQEDYIAIKINRQPLNAFIDEEISRWLDTPAEGVKIYTNEEEKVIIEGTGRDGTEVLRELLASSIELATRKKGESVIIPIKKITPSFEISEDLQQMGIKERLSVGHTSYYGSPGNRIHNIKVGAERFNGTIIAPGENFSFNTTLGSVSAATGYRQELVIKKEGTKPEYGGGLCQVSTTMYRTILLSGLPVTARRPHSYAVSYYSQVMGHGLDATIYLGGQDLRFENDTDNHILIQAYVQDDYELFISFYGTSDGRTVALEGPYLSNYHSPGPTQYIDTPTLPAGRSKQVENRHTGFNALWYRYITDKNGETQKETISSAYRAIPARVLVGTGA